MIVSAYKCPYTGKLFSLANEVEYKEHVKHHAAILREEIKFAKIKAGFADWLSAEKLNILTVEDIAPWFIKNQRKIMDGMNSIKFCYYSKSDRIRFQPGDNFTKLEIKVGQYSESISNIHVCPRGGVTNWWSRDNNGPTGYPGWNGSISASLSRQPKYNSSYPATDIFNFVDLHTGSGGGGNENTGYKLSIFLDDWPGIQETIIVQKLKGLI